MCLKPEHPQIYVSVGFERVISESPEVEKGLEKDRNLYVSYKRADQRTMDCRLPSRIMM